MASASAHQLNASYFPNKERRLRASLFFTTPALAPASNTPPLGTVFLPVQAPVPALQVRRDNNEIVQRPRQPVEFPHHQHVTGSAALQGLCQSFPPAQNAGRLVLVDNLAARRPQRVELQGKVLIVGRYPRI